MYLTSILLIDGGLRGGHRRRIRGEKVAGRRDELDNCDSGSKRMPQRSQQESGQRGQTVESSVRCTIRAASRLQRADQHAHTFLGRSKTLLAQARASSPPTANLRHVYRFSS